MASLAATMAVASHVSIRVPATQRPIQHRRTTGCASLVKQRSVASHVSIRVPVTLQPIQHTRITRCSVVKQRNESATQSDDVLTGSTRTVTTLLGMAVLCMKAFAKNVIVPLSSSSGTVSVSMGPLFFAAVRGLNTPMTVVAAGLRKWLDIYSGVLLVRVLLSWFPNIPWERQPLSAIRDLCDPYLSLFRNIIPPVFDTLDVSPLLAFAVLGALSNILKGTT